MIPRATLWRVVEEACRFRAATRGRWDADRFHVAEEALDEVLAEIPAASRVRR